MPAGMVATKLVNIQVNLNKYCLHKKNKNRNKVLGTICSEVIDVEENTIVPKRTETLGDTAEAKVADQTVRFM